MQFIACPTTPTYRGGISANNPKCSTGWVTPGVTNMSSVKYITCPTDEDGVTLTYVQNSPVCSHDDGNGNLTNAWEIVPIGNDFDVTQIDPAVMMGIFMVGFMFYAVPFMIGSHVGGLVKFFRNN